MGRLIVDVITLSSLAANETSEVRGHCGIEKGEC